MFNSQLAVFTCVADCGSFNKAAEKTYLSPPSVMKQINALEKHLELKLLDRTNQGIRLTTAGQVIYRHAKVLFDYIRQAVFYSRITPRVSQSSGELFTSVSSLVAQYGKIGSNLNQIARYLNEGSPPYQGLAAELRGAAADLAALKFDVLKVIGEAYGNDKTYQIKERRLWSRRAVSYFRA